MDDDRTVLIGSPGAPAPPRPCVVAHFEGPDGRRASRRFGDTFMVGREAMCEVVLGHEDVSRQHCVIERVGPQWFVRDLGSSNGTFLGGETVRRAALAFPAQLRLGADGPLLELELEGAPAAPARQPVSAPSTERAGPGTGATGTPGTRTGERESVTQIIARALESGDSSSAGLHTQIVQRTVKLVREREARRNRIIIGVIGALLIAALGVVGYQEFRIGKTRELAVELFYGMKSMELQVAELEDVVGVALERAQRDDLRSRKARMREMQARYEALVGQIEPLGYFASEEDRIIFKVARLFGECEVNMPQDFADEVKRYIKKWQSSSRMRNALAKLQERNYAPRIREVLAANDLPFQFLYLAMQESNFNEHAIGPKTRWGIAKGMWQFIPTTAREYGLRTGPLEGERRYDPQDERFDYYKASAAAARYLRDIYKGDAQASGLLVMASYNWGHNRVRRAISRMPENPRDRNFWNLLKNQKIPKETYDYVFHIVAAAVIAENPKLFGFDFTSPKPF